MRAWGYLLHVLRSGDRSTYQTPPKKQNRQNKQNRTNQNKPFRVLRALRQLLMAAGGAVPGHCDRAGHQHRHPAHLPLGLAHQSCPCRCFAPLAILCSTCTATCKLDVVRVDLGACWKQTCRAAPGDVEKASEVTRSPGILHGTRDAVNRTAAVKAWLMWHVCPQQSCTHTAWCRAVLAGLQAPRGMSALCCSPHLRMHQETDCPKPPGPPPLRPLWGCVQPGPANCWISEIGVGPFLHTRDCYHTV